MSLLFFSSRRRHTRCGRDWSSDVCSSDLSNYNHHDKQKFQMSLIENFRNIFKIEELRTRILYTVGILMIYRIGTYVTMPRSEERRVGKECREGEDGYG